jgi:hypothetical protein
VVRACVFFKVRMHWEGRGNPPARGRIAVGVPKIFGGAF